MHSRFRRLYFILLQFISMHYSLSHTYIQVWFTNSLSHIHVNYLLKKNNASKKKRLKTEQTTWGNRFILELSIISLTKSYIESLKVENTEINFCENPSNWDMIKFFLTKYILYTWYCVFITCLVTSAVKLNFKTSLYLPAKNVLRFHTYSLKMHLKLNIYAPDLCVDLF